MLTAFTDTGVLPAMDVDMATLIILTMAMVTTARGLPILHPSHTMFMVLVDTMVLDMLDMATTHPMLPASTTEAPTARGRLTPLTAMDIEPSDTDTSAPLNMDTNMDMAIMTNISLILSMLNIYTLFLYQSANACIILCLTENGRKN